MSYLSRLFSTRSLKFLLLLACAAVIAAAIWYLGPFSGFGNAHPLESVSARCLCIAVALLWLARLWWRIPFFLPLALTVSVIIWVAGPWVLAGKSYPLASSSRRLVVIAVLWLVVLIYAIWLLVVTLIHNPALLNRLKGLSQPTEKQADKHVAITRQIRHAVALTSRVRTHWKRWWTLLLPGVLPDTVPWYVLLGDEGAGKTALITTSGQDFPLPEQLSRIAQENAPTVNCECWFGNDALFLDTAGKYISDDAAATDEWQHLLKTLHKYRAQDGINGAIIAIPVADFLQRSKESKLTLATRLRARLDELRQQLGVHFPVYVIVTKVDQLSGFEPWFRGMTREAHDQVWGVTFPWGEMVHTSTSGLQQKIVSELDALQQRLANTLHPRQQEEYSLSDRKAMYTFPLDFQLLCREVADFLQQAFFSSRYDETQFCASFRGIYFSSSCQMADTRLHNHKTVVSRWRHYFTRDQQETPAFSAQLSAQDDPLPQGMAWGKHYFLKQLFADVIVKDAPLATHNFREETRYRLQRLFSHTALLLLAVILINGLVVSFNNNAEFLDAVSGKTRQLETAVAGLRQFPDNTVLPGLLAMSRRLPDVENLNLFEPTIDYRYGLYTGQAVATHANGLYRFMLQRFLLPSLQNQATASLSAALQAKDNDALYNALKIYLGIYGQAKAPQSWLTEAITQQWEAQDKLTAYGDESVFQQHLMALFAQPEWLHYSQKADAELITQARAALGQHTLNARLYQRVKSEALTQAAEPMTLDKMTGDTSTQIFTLDDEDLAQNGIPGFFTRAGYQMLIKKKFLYLITQLQREDEWVMGTREDVSANPLTVREGVLRLYLQEYSSWWTRLLDSIQLIPLDMAAADSHSPLAGDIYVLRILASPDSPLVNIARVAVEQTTLAQKDKTQPELLDVGNNRFTNNRVINQVKKLDEATDYLVKKLTRSEVDERFRALREFVNGQGNPLSMEGGMAGLPGSQLNKLSSTLSELYTLFVVTSNSLSNGDTPVMPDTSKRIGIQAQTWPTPFRTIIEPFLNGASNKVEAKVLTSNSKNIDDNLGEVCRATLVNRYPFRHAVQEVNPHDFEQFFARDGLVDSWFRQNLADKVDTSQPVWRYKGSQEEGNLAFFQQVARIRNAFFASDSGKKMSFSPTLSITYMDPAIVQLNMNMAGNPFHYIHGPVVPWLFNWPGNNGSTNIDINALPSLPGSPSLVALNSPWALFRWMDTATKQQVGDDGNIILTFSIDKRRMDVTLGGMVSENATLAELLNHFECPQSNDYGQEIFDE
ncbi:MULTISPECIES: type VI secretion system membrane subunit TssM [Enterobacterales]|uniref:type VI secretion system membrane subunit TssM n=1 Tax=Enterobacterales TaxID=91347 RepID=UPI002ED8A701